MFNVGVVFACMCVKRMSAFNCGIVCVHKGCLHHIKTRHADYILLLSHSKIN